MCHPRLLPNSSAASDGLNKTPSKCEAVTGRAEAAPSPLYTRNHRLLFLPERFLQKGDGGGGWGAVNGNFFFFLRKTKEQNILPWSGRAAGDCSPPCAAGAAGRLAGASPRRGWAEAGLGPSPPGHCRAPRGSRRPAPPRRPGRGAEALLRAAGTKPGAYQPRSVWYGLFYWSAARACCCNGERHWPRSPPMRSLVREMPPVPTMAAGAAPHRRGPRRPAPA